VSLMPPAGRREAVERPGGRWGAAPRMRRYREQIIKRCLATAMPL